MRDIADEGWNPELPEVKSFTGVTDSRISVQKMSRLLIQR